MKSGTSPEGLEHSIDPKQIEQTLINLVQNAQQVLEIRNDGVIKLLARLDKQGRTNLEISDNGPGIEEKNLGKIFVPYSPLKYPEL